MSDVPAFGQKLEEIGDLWTAQEYDAALDLVDGLRQEHPANAHSHVLWASLLQLQTNRKRSLDEAEQALRQAIDLEPASPIGSIEMGYLIDLMGDDPQAATKFYAEGIVLARHLLIEGLIGGAKALLQINRVEEAFRHALEVHKLLGFEGDKAGDPDRSAPLDDGQPTDEKLWDGSRTLTSDQIERFLDGVIARRSA